MLHPLVAPVVSPLVAPGSTTEPCAQCSRTRCASLGSHCGPESTCTGQGLGEKELRNKASLQTPKEPRADRLKKKRRKHGREFLQCPEVGHRTPGTSVQPHCEEGQTHTKGVRPHRALAFMPEAALTDERHLQTHMEQ